MEIGRPEKFYYDFDGGERPTYFECVLIFHSFYFFKFRADAVHLCIYI